MSSYFHMRTSIFVLPYAYFQLFSIVSQICNVIKYFQCSMCLLIINGDISNNTSLHFIHGSVRMQSFQEQDFVTDIFQDLKNSTLHREILTMPSTRKGIPPFELYVRDCWVKKYDLICESVF